MLFTHAPAFKKRSQGFTLIEILVVVIIISVSIGLVVVNITSGSAEQVAKEETIRLQQLLKFAHEQSVIRAEEYGIRFYTTGYRFMKHNAEDDSWIDLTQDKLLRSRVLPEPLELDLYIEQLPVEILDSFDDDPEVEEEKENALETAASNIQPGADNNTSKKDEIKPQVFLLSSSELTPQFELILRVPGSDIEEQLQGLPQGEYKRVTEEDDF